MPEKTMIPYLEMGGAFVLGLSIGYAIKKSFKVLLLVLGLGLIFVFLLENQGAITINEAMLQSKIELGMDSFQAMLVYFKERLGEYTAMGSMSAVAGFLVGLKLG